MAAVALADCAVHKQHEGDVEVAYIVPPSTMDSADTIDITTLLNGRTCVDHKGYDTAAEDEVTTTMASSVITVDAAGGQSNVQYVIKVAYMHL